MFLNRDVFAARIGPDLVLLDLETDAYLCVADASAEVSSSGCIRSAELSASLEEAGLVNDEQSQTKRPPPLLPRQTCLHGREVEVTLAHWWAAGRASLDVRRLGKSCDVATYLALTGNGRRDRERVLAASRAFERIQPWLPFDGECLERTALLAAFLARLNLRADWVIAVRVWPFKAHCWLQFDEYCLNDDPERLTALTPILVR